MSVKLQDILPTPSSRDDSSQWVSNDPWFRKHDAVVPVESFEPPPYGHRQKFVPKKLGDYGDGGAFPEILIAQFPLDMGKGGNRAISGSTLALQVDQDGKVQYDAIVKVGSAKDKVVYTKLGDTKSKYYDESDPSVQKPDDEAIAENTQKTRAALEKITNAKISASLPVQLAEKTAPAQYIRYTPSQQSHMHAAGSEQRLIRMVEEQKDPMEPPRFKINQKIPPPPPSPPAPVMHSPPRKVTAKEQADWKIPPCISNWKNPKGYTIPLDKRLAADGRGLQQVHINENFSKLAEALYIADRKAREAVEARSQLEKRLAQKKKEEQEEQMREMARKAREERQGIRPAAKDDDEKQRDEFRRDRQNERRRERNIERAKPEKVRKQKEQAERDISEKIALGIADPRRGEGGGGEGVQFDERLFNQSQGMDSGMADDMAYPIYDKPWRPQDNVTKNIYRPSKNADSDIYGADLEKVINTQRFVPDKGFSGADTSSKRDGPVQFEKSEADPFGLGDLLADAKKGSKRKGDESKRDDEKRKR